MTAKKRPRNARRAQRKKRAAKPERVFPFSLVEKKLDGRKFVEFPQMRGKTLEKIHLFTTAEYHSITLDFHDRTSLALRIEPCFSLQATYSDIHMGDQSILEEWVPVHSAT